MSSRFMILRSCTSSSLRSLLHRHLRRAAVAPPTDSQSPASIHNFHYLLPNGIVNRTANSIAGFSIDSAGFSTKSVDQASRNPSKKDELERKIDESEEDDSEVDESVFEDFDDDDEDDDDDFDDDFVAYGSRR